MSELLSFLMPALAFVLVAVLIIEFQKIWDYWFSRDAQLLNSRLVDIDALGSKQSNDSLIKKSELSQSLFIDLLYRWVPAVKGLDLVIQRSGTPITLKSVLLISIACGLAPLITLLLVSRIPFLVILLSAIASSSIPIVYLYWKAAKRLRTFEDQLPDALDYLIRSLRAGHAIPESMRMVGEEFLEPLGREFKITSDELKYGLTFSQAVTNLANRMNSIHVNFFAVGIKIQRETGGNITDLLSGLSKTIRERIKLKGKIRVLAAEGKITAKILVAIPIAIGLLMSMINPESISILWTTSTGRTLVMYGLLMLALGIFWLSRLVKIEA